MTEPKDRPRGPVLIELGGTVPPSPADAPPVPEPATGRPEGRAMQIAARLAARPPSRLSRFFWRMALALLGFVVSVAAWNFVSGLMATNVVVGWVGLGILALFLLAALLLGLRELAAWSRLARLDRVHAAVLEATAAGDLKVARKVVGRLEALYKGRPEMEWSRARLDERKGDVFDADALFMLAETELMAPLDAAARLEVEAAARLVATVTAIVPLALADVVAALVANLRMIRRLAEIYGGRAGTFGSLRLARTVMTHLVATGAVAVGDDLVGSVAGGGILSKVSRRFGEGIVNGALTARVGVAAIEVCRPMPFVALPRPKVTNLVGRALTGVFSRDKGVE